MSIADTLRLLSLEATVAELLARVAVLEDMVADTRAFCEARQGAEATARAVAERASQQIGDPPLCEMAALTEGRVPCSH